MRDQAVCLDQVDNHVPLATVADEVVGKVGDEAVIDGKFSMLDHELKVIVGLVELVPEKEVRLDCMIS